MKYILTADLHLRMKNPRNRIDDFYRSQILKMEFILEQCKLHDAALLVAGDIFDGSSPSYEVVSTYLNLLKNFNGNIFAIAGNHDLRNHRIATLPNTGLGILISARAIKVLSSEPIEFKNTILRGFHWGEEITNYDKGKYNIALIHEFVVNDDTYLGEEISIQGSKLIDDFNYNLILSGHHHKSFLCKSGDKILCNPGSISRLTSGQIDYFPRVGLIDTCTKDFQWINLPIQPSSEVFNLGAIETKKESKLEMQNFVTELKKNGVKNSKEKFRKALEIHLKENKYEDEVVDIIHEVV